MILGENMTSVDFTFSLDHSKWSKKVKTFLNIFFLVKLLGARGAKRPSLGVQGGRSAPNF
jgi:hypothetical protein